MRVGLNTLACMPGRSGGDATYVRELVRHLEAVDPQSEYVLFVAPWNQHLFPPPSGRLQHIVCRAPGGSFAARVVWEHTLLPRLVEAARLDLFHAPVNVAPAYLRTPFVLTLLEAEPFMPDSRIPVPLLAYWRLARAWSARRARTVVAISEAAALELMRYMHLPARKLTVIHLGVDDTRFPAPADAPRDGYLLWVGRSYPRKNLVRLVEAYSALSPDLRSSHPLVLVGVEGWDDARLRRRVRELGLEAVGHVRFAGRVPDESLPEWYRKASLFVFPSLHEAYGLPVLEALASGTPVLASDIPALREVAGDAVDYVSPTDCQAMTAAMHRMLTSPELADQRRARGLKRVQQFSWRATAEATHAVYARALGA